MFDCFRKFLCLVLGGFLAIVPTVQAQESSSAAPVPPQVLSAHAVFVSNGGGSNYFEIFRDGPDRPYNTLYADLEKANRYQLVDSPAQADLVFEIRAIAPAVGDVDEVNYYNPQIILSVRDPKTSIVLWTTRANVLVFGTQRHRDKELDESVAVLLDKLGLVTGQPLSPQQVKAIHKNSSMPTAIKVLLIVGIAGGAASVAYGIYEATHPPSLPPLPPLPPLPAQPTFP